MAPSHVSNHAPESEQMGPKPSSIQVAKPFIFEHTIQECVRVTAVPQAREDQIRLSGIQWIDSVRKALRLPVRTFDTAAVYYHKFRLLHPDNEYSSMDAAAAALFTACKIEDTLKKSRDIICAAHNLRLPVHEHLSPDESLFEAHSRAIIGLERLMLEASSFDFRNRHPQQLVVKLAKHFGVERNSHPAKTAYRIALDIYRTFAPLKQTTAALAFACLELAGRLLNQPISAIDSDNEYEQWRISRLVVMETLLDLLELYTHYRNSTILGPEFPLDVFLEVRIPLNQEMSSKRLPRYSEWKDDRVDDRRHHHHHHQQQQQQQQRNSQSSQSKHLPNGVSKSANGPRGSPRDSSAANISPSAGSPSTLSASGPNGTRSRTGDAGRDSTVRFMLDPKRELDESAVVSRYLRPPEQRSRGNVRQRA